MSRDAEDPRPPKRIGPPADRDRTAKPRPGPKPPDQGRTPPDSEEPSTFRPNPGRNTPSDPPERGSSTFQANPKRPGPGTSKPVEARKPSPVTGGPNWFERLTFGRVSTGHLALFSRQLASYLDAGVDILRSLDNLQTQFARTALGPILARVALGVRRGDSLTDAMAREPRAFDGQFLAMITVAEARGGVPETLKRMASGLEARQRLLRQARSAMIYPIAVLTIAFGVGMLLTLSVLPGLVGILEDTVRGRSIELPLPTRVLVSINTFMLRMGWLVLPLGLVGTVFGLFWLYRRPRGKAFLDEIAMRLPVLGKLFRMIDTTRFARTLSALLEAGVDIGGSLDLTAATMTLVPFRRAVAGSRAAVMEGSDLSEALRDSGRFTPDVIAVVETGEETGKLPESLERLADDYENRVEHMVKNLGNLIQPLLYVFLGGIVLFIAVAFLSAYALLLTSL